MRPSVIWSCTGRSSKSHYLDEVRFRATGKRFSLCGRVIADTGDDLSCAQDAPCGCKACERIFRIMSRGSVGYYWDRWS